MRIPVGYTEYDELMSNIDGNINKDVADVLKTEPYFGQYSGWNFCGYVWFQDGKWHCEVWCHKFYNETISEETLEGIMKSVSNSYGWD